MSDKNPSLREDPEFKDEKYNTSFSLEENHKTWKSTWIMHSLIFLLQSFLIFLPKKLKYLNQKSIKDRVCSRVCSKLQTLIAQTDGREKRVF